MLRVIASLYLLLSLSTNPTVTIPFTQTSATHAAVASLDLLSVHPIPTKKPEYVSPIITGTSSLAIDLSTNTVLYEKNISEERPIASLSKLMTAVITMEEGKENDVVIVSGTAASTPGSTVWLSRGETITVKNLLAAVMIPSGNDAAVALAEYNAGSEKAFVEKMNAYAKKFGMTQTKFVNATGLDGDIENTSTAYDLAILSRYALQYPLLRQYAATKELTITSTEGATTHKLETTNELLGSYLDLKGLKTGYTIKAGECFIAVKDTENGNEILTIVLNATDRFKDTKLLLDWVLHAYNW